MKTYTAPGHETLLDLAHGLTAIGTIGLGYVAAVAICAAVAWKLKDW